MNQDLIDKLNKGIYLEKSNQLLLWKTPFDSLKNLEKPKHKKTSNQREDLIWKNEKILNGLTTDLIIMMWFGLFGMNKKFEHAYGNISQADFEKTRERLNLELGQTGKYKKINNLEHKHTWTLECCKIKLIQGERFGPNWTINIQHKSSWYGRLK